MKLKSLALALIATTSLGLATAAVWAAEFNLTYSTTYTPTHPYGQADEECGGQHQHEQRVRHPPHHAAYPVP